MYAKMDPWWLAWKLDPNSSKLNTPLIFELKGPLNISALQEASSFYINEFHQSALCYFHEDNHIVEQRFLDKVLVEFEYINIENVSIDLAIQDFCKTPFDLSCPPLFKFGLLILPEKKLFLSLIFIMQFLMHLRAGIWLKNWGNFIIIFRGMRLIQNLFLPHMKSACGGEKKII